MGSLLRRLEDEAKRANIDVRSEEAREWFRTNVRSLVGNTVNRNQLLKDEELVRKSRSMAGHMYMYFYDPKTRDSLPYYDAFPLTIMVQRAPGGFYGLNLHYLSLKTRVLFLDKLSETLTNDRFDETTRFRIRYDLLNGVKKYREFQPCFKRYLSNHIDSRLMLVQPKDWNIAMFLPTEQFVNAKKQSVWSDSRKIIRGS